jgi:hypothetical protein
MLSTDREEFVALLEKLCAGYNLPCGKKREEAYWSGMARMSLLQFARVVDRALSEEGPEKFPGVHELWDLHKQQTRTTHVQAEAPKDERDTLGQFANRLLLIHIANRGGLGSAGRFVPPHGMLECEASPELAKVLEMKRALVQEFCGYILEGDDLSTPREFVRRWLFGLSRIGEVSHKTLEQYRVMVSSPDAQMPFPASMARGNPKQDSLPLLA